jgi:cell fate regulator YaaT (PSP1 superfamily)
MTERQTLSFLPSQIVLSDGRIICLLSLSEEEQKNQKQQIFQNIASRLSFCSLVR